MQAIVRERLQASQRGRSSVGAASAAMGAGIPPIAAEAAPTEVMARGQRGRHEIRQRRPRTDWPQPDFAPKPDRSALIGWALAAVGALVLVTAVLDALHLQQATDAARQELQRWQRVARQHTPVATRPNTASSRSETARQRAWQVAAGLAHPWPSLFAATDAPAPAGLQWQRLQHDAATGEVLIEGRSPQPLAALPLVEQLTGQPGWQDVVLVRLEQQAGEGGARFEIHARLRGKQGAVSMAGEPGGAR